MCVPYIMYSPFAFFFFCVILCFITIHKGGGEGMGGILRLRFCYYYFFAENFFYLFLFQKKKNVEGKASSLETLRKEKKGKKKKNEKRSENTVRQLPQYTFRLFFFPIIFVVCNESPWKEMWKKTYETTLRHVLLNEDA